MYLCISKKKEENVFFFHDHLCSEYHRKERQDIDEERRVTTREMFIHSARQILCIDFDQFFVEIDEHSTTHTHRKGCSLFDQYKCKITHQ